MNRASRWFLLLRWLCASIFLSWAGIAQAYAIDFESLGDGDPVGLSYPGIDFSNVTVIRAGLSLNDFEFPPRSGEAVAFDDGGVMLLSFAAPIEFFEGFVTYTESLLITAFNSSNAVVATSTTLFANNLALSGDSGSKVNEVLRLSGDGIRRIEIAGNPGGTSFVLDDVSFRLASPVPEPTSLILCGAGLAAVVLLRTRSNTRKQTVRPPRGLQEE